MVTEAASAGFWDTDWGQIPRLQIVTVEQLLTSPAPPIRIPMARSDTYRKVAREERAGRQGGARSLRPGRRGSIRCHARA
jgi:hypothetical protein